MNYKQIKQLWGSTAYRYRLLFFVLLGTSTLFGSWRVQDPYWQDLLANFAVTFAAVGLIDFMWDILGGDPKEIVMKESFAELNQRVDKLNQSLSVVAGLTSSSTGIERIWKERKHWDQDETDSFAVWKERICQAKEVNIVSNTFKRPWTYDDDFLDRLWEAVNKGTIFRLVIYDPDSEILKIRAQHEKDPENEMKNEIRYTLDRFTEKISQLPKNARENIQIRLNSTYYQMAQILQADDRILVTLYLSKRSGSLSPTLQIAGRDSSFFDIYSKQFEILWKEGKPFIPKILKSSQIKHLRR